MAIDPLRELENINQEDDLEDDTQLQELHDLAIELGSHPVGNGDDEDVNNLNGSSDKDDLLVDDEEEEESEEDFDFGPCDGEEYGRDDDDFSNF